ncbi:hemicentin-1-like isoform X1 [Girardinichthys multiradiatus]|uniref:hemicentin-1-like isoform X1 n=1 Tax=Girardinichthys multiradiatus TaxID=208333 RepID=UPI001FABB07E|nr:hemicentin-1-like isoform X1 [Girardinichthys multiradiatus]
MTQLSNTTSSCEAQWKMWLLQVFVLIYLTTVCAAQESVSPTPPVETDATFMATTAYDPPVPSLHLASGSSDVFTSEKVILSCNVSGSSGWTFTWQKDGQPLNQNADFSFPGDGSVLTITANKKDLTGKYACKGHDQRKGDDTKTSQLVEVKVAELPTLTLKRDTPWADVFEGEAVSFRCEPPSSHWNIIWHKDQKPMNEKGSSFIIKTVTKSDEGKYTCQAQFKSRSVISGFSNTESLNVNPNNPKVSLIRKLDYDKLYPEESIEFTCNVNLISEWKYEWYHNGTKIEGSSNKNYIIVSVTYDNNGEYECKVKRGEGPVYISNNISVQVADRPTPTLKLETPWSDVFETEVLKFSCEVPSTEWTVTWYRDQHNLKEGPSLEITSVRDEDGGKYTCKAQLTSRKVWSGPSNPVVINVREKPMPVLTKSPSFPMMYPGESINFTCTVGVFSGWEYEWYHNGNKVLFPSSSTNSIGNLSHDNSGEYRCVAKRGALRTNSRSVSLQVSNPPKPILKLLSPWQNVFENETLKFSCDVSSSEWIFTWYRGQAKLQNNSRLIQNEKGSMLNISAVRSSDQGQYTCKAHLKQRVVISESSYISVSVYDRIPTPTLNIKPLFTPMYIGETVKLNCAVSVSSDWSYEWYKDGTPDPHKTGKEISIKVNLSDKGGYSCKAKRGEKTLTGHSNTVQLDVQEIPVPLLKPKTQWLDVFPSEGVELSCSMPGSSGWTFTWYKNPADDAKDTTTMSNEGESLSITNAKAMHRGKYTCSGKLKERFVSSKNSSEVTLHVYDEKPTVTLQQNPEDNLMHTSDYISFTCHVNVSSGWNYVWYKDKNPIDTSGIVHNISSAKTSQSGSYQCQVKRGAKTMFWSENSQAVKLTIAERPKAGITLLTGWSEVFSTDSLVLQCDVDESNKWNYTWFKEDKELYSSLKYTVTPQDDPEQSLYTCQGFSDKRPLYSKPSDSYRTKNLLLKRRILLSISGCLFFGIIAVFIGCIALRIFRKPVAVGDKQQEPNLFLTMAQLKDRNDAPSPLIEYITEADLNPPDKEGEENGTSCNETTPLPISSPEEQGILFRLQCNSLIRMIMLYQTENNSASLFSAVTTNGKDTTENGGGMVSFLH